MCIYIYNIQMQLGNNLELQAYKYMFKTDIPV